MSAIVYRLQSLFPQTHLALAVLQRKEAGGYWEAQTRSGRPVRLYGAGEAGRQVLYDTATGRITGAAPDIEMTDMAAE